jgi:signal transduction histidine kinase
VNASPVRSYIRKKLEILRTVTFRLAVGSAGILAGSLLVAFGLIYWQISDYELTRAPQGVYDLHELRDIVLRTLAIWAVPAVILSLLGGGWLSHRALRRVGVMHQAIDRIMGGDLHERIPTLGDYDEMERMAGSVNRMLERIEFLVEEIRGVGDDIAHDLRTPLTRVRSNLDRSRLGTPSVEALQIVIDRSIVDLDQCFGVITAVLRIGEIDSGRRRAAFGAVDLADVAATIFDLYEPIADEKQIALWLSPSPAVCGRHVLGDRDLLVEAAANLIDNAIKFTPSGGHVTVDVGVKAARLFLRVADDGPGIAGSERTAIMARFYRSDKSRHLPGSGLGLSLVSAIARLHDAQVVVDDAGPGAIFTLNFPIFEPQRVAQLV